ncbi:MAG: hypothetical protein J5746_14385, partial [Victivallales bacterium]|nr:hypothetical protein [Victivallales bacterium]
VPVRVAAPSRELVVRDGQVILPETQSIAPTDKEFEGVLVRAIPNDELPELLDALHGKRPAYSPVLKLLFLVGFAVIGALAFFFRPRTPELIDSSTTLVIDTQTPSKVSSDYSALLKQANAAYESGRYAETIKIISPKMEEILKDQEVFRANARLVSIFFSAHEKNGFPRNAPGFDEWIDKACKYDPDNLEWQIYNVCLLWQPFQNIHKSEYRLNAILNNERHSFNLAKACLTGQRQIDRIRRLNANKPAESRLTENTVTTLDMIECQVLIAKWRIDGGKMLPDDKDDPGVEFREKAYSLASRHENDIPFLDIQLYIAEKVLDGLVSVLHGQYYFNGETHWKLEPLETTIREIKVKKAKLSQPRKQP